MTETWFAAFTKSLEAPATPLEALAEALTRRRAINPVLLHRDILRQVEQRQADAMDDGTDVTTRTGKLFPLFPQYKIRSHFTALDKTNVFLEGHDSAVVLRAFFPERKGWEPAHQIVTDAPGKPAAPPVTPPSTPIAKSNAIYCRRIIIGLRTSM